VHPFQHENRKGQHEPDPEAAAHVDEFGIGAGVRSGQFGLERHSADRTGTGTDLPDFGMHRAGVDGAFRHCFGGALRFVEVLCRIGGEFCAAAGGAKIIGVAAMRVSVLCRVRIDCHAADRIDGAARHSAVMVVVMHDVSHLQAA